MAAKTKTRVIPVHLNPKGDRGVQYVIILLQQGARHAEYFVRIEGKKIITTLKQRDAHKFQSPESAERKLREIFKKDRKKFYFLAVTPYKRRHAKSGRKKTKRH